MPAAGRAGSREPEELEPGLGTCQGQGRGPGRGSWVRPGAPRWPPAPLVLLLPSVHPGPGSCNPPGTRSPWGTFHGAELTQNSALSVGGGEQPLMAEVPSATPVRCQAAPMGEHSTRGARSFTQGQHKASGTGLGTHFPVPHAFGTRASLPSAGTALALRARREIGRSGARARSKPGKEEQGSGRHQPSPSPS